MLTMNRKGLIGQGGDRTIIYSGLFLVCALLSALGAGSLGALAFIPAAVAVEATTQLGKHFGPADKSQETHSRRL